MAIDITADKSLFVADLGESVTYRPYGGTARSILAIVDRNAPDAFGEIGNTPVFIVTVVNDATTGIASTGISTGNDLIDLAERYGETASSRKITRILRHDAAIITFEAR